MPLWIPTVFCIVCAFLIVVPCYVAPWETGMGVFITVLGIPFYYVGVVWKNKPEWFMNGVGRITNVCQKLFLSAKEEEDNEDDTNIQIASGSGSNNLTKED